MKISFVLFSVFSAAFRGRDFVVWLNDGWVGWVLFKVGLLLFWNKHGSSSMVCKVFCVKNCVMTDF